MASLATLCALILGVAAAWVLAFRRFPGRDLLDAALTMPLALPPTVLGYFLLVMIGRASPLGRVWEALFGAPLVFTWKAAVVAAFLHSAPLLIKMTRAALESTDPSYAKAARTLGASEWRVFFLITVPLIARQLWAATALAFARSLGDFGITIMIAGNIPGQTQTLSVAIYDAVEGGQGVVARTLVLIVSAVAFGAVLLVNRLSARTQTP